LADTRDAEANDDAAGATHDCDGVLDLGAFVVGEAVEISLE
jgi:hypothetical protein